MASVSSQKNITLKMLWRDFFAFVRRPDLKRASPRQLGDGWQQDWKRHLGFSLLIKWAFVLWGISLFLLAPIVWVVSESVGANHKLEFALPIIPLAVLWAPLVEELLFRYPLRRPVVALWVVPITIFILLSGPAWYAFVSMVLLLFFILVLWPKLGLTQQRYGLKFKYLRIYRQAFPYIMHLSVAAFALVHVLNYEGGKASFVLLPLMVLPQWFTGLFLAWLRTRYSIVASIVFHAIFNSGPILIALIFYLTLPPELLQGM